MYSQAAVSSASVAARAVLRWDGTPEKGGTGATWSCRNLRGALPLGLPQRVAGCAGQQFRR